ncbi:hypothetical protein ACIQM4_34090 [Streptomyces sp. NPDC091272]|uniref:hypothetical protein n=1 Tax=Streptomyces sp. NPDC091272 TaxID=3365981 RepID=UPI0038115A90
MLRLTARLGAVTAAAGMVLISGAATAGAAPTDPAGTRPTTSAAANSPDRQAVTVRQAPPDRQAPTGRQALPDRQAPPARQALWNYRGVQGGNLCLLSRCTVGSGTAGSQGPSNTQGFNLCLLSACDVRP